MKEVINIVKIGGSVTDNPKQLEEFLIKFSQLKGLKILVHGGGKKATQISGKLGLKTQFIDGRRVTDADTLEVAIMVYAGLVNKNIVAKLQQFGTNAIGMSGADANIMITKIRDKSPIDFGYVGDFNNDNSPSQSKNKSSLIKLIKLGLTVVVCSITHNGEGQLLNTNADTIAERLASILNDDYEVFLHYCFEHHGVLSNIDDANSIIPTLELDTYISLKDRGIIHSGLIPKVDSAFKSVAGGVKVRICHYTALDNDDLGTKFNA